MFRNLGEPVSPKAFLKEYSLHTEQKNQHYGLIIKGRGRMTAYKQQETANSLAPTRLLSLKS